MTVEGKTLPAPKGLDVTGRKLWRSILGKYELEQHELLILTEACRVADRLQRIADESEHAELTSVNFKGDPVANPLLVESRQQAIVFTRLLASLRLPVDEEDVGRPQRRGGARGTYNRAQWAVS